MNKKIDSKEVKSINKNVRSSVRKLKPILRSLIGKKVDIAIRDLTFSEKRISKDIKKTISSAIANAENNFQYDIDKLFVKEAYCGKQVIMKDLGQEPKEGLQKLWNLIQILRLFYQNNLNKWSNMGQKVNPIGLRLGINRGWDSVWYAKKKDFGSYLIEDFRIREYIKKN